MSKTTYHRTWLGDFIRKRLSRSFKTLEEAQRFAEGKKQAEIYRSRGKYVVEWIKEIRMD